MREFVLPSKAVLKISPAPFADAKDLFQAILEEAKGVSIDNEGQMADLLKNVFCYAFASKRVSKALEKCLDRCRYNDSKISEETFEAVEARPDYLVVQLEVTKENILPFLKSLYAEYQEVMSLLKNSLA